MGGLLVLALIAGYIWGAAKLFKHVGPYWAKALVVVAAILTSDGRCRLWTDQAQADVRGRRSGLHIYRVVEGARGVRCA
jgi:hypothetical protein